jgi:hypothetical protein
MRVAFLTPNLPPIVCGLADQSALMGQALSRAGWDVVLIGLHGDPERAGIEGNIHSMLKWDGSVGTLARVVGAAAPDWLWVQLSGYGYSRWGAPWILNLALSRVRRQYPRLRLAVYLHEGHCTPGQLGLKGPLLSPWQRWTVGRIVRLSDLVVATTPYWHSRCVADYRADPERVKLLPIGSSVPPLRLTAAERERVRAALSIGTAERVAVTFGKWQSQRGALECLGGPLRAAIAAGTIDRIVALGGEQPTTPSWCGEMVRHTPWSGRLQFMGPLPAKRVAEVLAAADIGLVSTPWDVWRKSSAARAMEQAQLTLWISDGGLGCREIPPPHDAPRWESIAASASRWLSASECCP